MILSILNAAEFIYPESLPRLALPSIEPIPNPFVFENSLILLI